MSRRVYKPPYQRTRVNKDVNSSTVATFNNNLNQGQTMIQQSARQLDMMTDIVTPGYQQKVNQGLIINNPASKVVQDTTVHPGIFRRDYSTTPPSWGLWSNFDLLQFMKVPGNGSLVFDDRSPVTLDQIDSLRRQSILAAIANIDAPSVAFAEDFFESGKAFETMRNPIQTLEPSHRALVKGLKTYDENYASLIKYRARRQGQNQTLELLKQRSQIVRGVSQLWLTARFGYAQLAYSAMSLNTLRRKMLGNRAHTDRVNGRLRATGVAESVFDQSGPFKYRRSDNAYDAIFYSQSKRHIKAKTTIIYARKSIDPASGLTKDLGLRLKDMPRTAWNLLPSSWFVDRFVDISSMLQGFMNLYDPRLEILSACYTITSDHYDDTTLSSVVPLVAGLTCSGTCSTNHYEGYITRTPFKPTFEYLIPPSKGLESLKDTKKFIDEATLVISKITKIQRGWHTYTSTPF